ncbi:MAG: molybdopterin cofactor-binding domain-containing protein, partial [Candidatus Caldarchaeum sp.]
EVTQVWPGAACGRIINPAISLGQIHGAIAQGLGYSLLERLEFEEGRILTANFMDYLIPSALEIPEIQDPVYFEDKTAYGPFGAKGLAELALIPIPAAVANAVRDALGIEVNNIPIKPEQIKSLIEKGG